MFKPKLIREMSNDEVRLMRVLVRRYQNATARRLGFRNFAEWQS